MHTASQALAIERQASAQPSLAERVSRPKTRAILGLMRLNFLSVRRSLLARLGNTGLVLGTLFFAASLTPSLTPRITVAQAVLSGMCLAAGYGLGVLLR
ncbi:MAG: alpha/beta-hydrolase N-terminal domain-containing protein, partial [Giesbergeria sp.]